MADCEDGSVWSESGAEWVLECRCVTDLAHMGICSERDEGTSQRGPRLLRRL